jgi:hypothetical protein
MDDPMSRASIEARVVRERRELVAVFTEYVCDDLAIIVANVALKVSAGDPDDATTSPVEVNLHLRRIKQRGHLPDNFRVAPLSSQSSQDTPVVSE